MLLALVLAGLVGATEDAAVRARLNEARNRLGLPREEALRGLAGRLAWILKTEGERVHNGVVGVMTRIGEYPTRTTPAPIDAIVVWLVREQKKAPRLRGFLTPLWFTPMASLQSLRDWFLAVRPNVTEMSFDEALATAKHWHEDLAKREVILQRERLQAQEESLRWEDGWYAVTLRTPEDLDAESDALGHCLGSGAYDAELAQPDIRRFVSLRDPKGVPKLTVEMLVDPGTTVWSIGQARGRGNRLALEESLHAAAVRLLKAMVPDTIRWGSDGWALLDEAAFRRVVRQSTTEEGQSYMVLEGTALALVDRFETAAMVLERFDLDPDNRAVYVQMSERVHGHEGSLSLEVVVTSINVRRQEMTVEGRLWTSVSDVDFISLRPEKVRLPADYGVLKAFLKRLVDAIGREAGWVDVTVVPHSPPFMAPVEFKAFVIRPERAAMGMNRERLARMAWRDATAGLARSGEGG